MLLDVFGIGSGTLILGDYGIWYFGIRNLVLIFGIDCSNPEFGLRFSQASGVIMALQYYLQFIAQGGY